MFCFVLSFVVSTCFSSDAPVPTGSSGPGSHGHSDLFVAMQQTVVHCVVTPFYHCQYYVFLQLANLCDQTRQARWALTC